jgi:hypothetical protein
MSDRVRKIREASVALDSLHQRIHETVRARDRSAEDHDRWKRACAEFHSRFDQLFYPGGDASLDALKRHEPHAISQAIDFLDADPMHHRSGYTKEEVWRRLRHAPLGQRDKARLEAIALRYLDRRLAREFWVMAATMAVIASATFWDRVREAASSATAPERMKRAAHLSAYEHGAAVGSRNRHQVRRDYLMRKFGDR